MKKTAVNTAVQIEDKLTILKVSLSFFFEKYFILKKLAKYPA